MPLSADDVTQAKTGSATANTTAAVVLDTGTQEGSTVIIEISAGGIPLTDPISGTTIPAGFEYDANSFTDTVKYCFVFRKSNVAAGEGVSGSTSWDFVYTAPINWHWRVTEWDTALDPVSPLESFVSNWDLGTSPTSLSTGTTLTNRAETVSLTWHMWTRPTNTAQSFDWSGHTNGFTERDELRITQGGNEFDSCWAWCFNSVAGAVETTATINLTTRNSSDIYTALLVVYAAAVPVVELAGGGVTVAGG